MRDTIRQYLREAHVPPARVADAVLVASELATNARDAAQPGTPVRVAGRVNEDRIVLQVMNHRQGHTSPFLETSMPAPDEVRGRGLATVASLTSRLSADVENRQTIVQAELDI
jgi:anti-sigma regulatory factor (Ser/Thr protein kinase)